MDISSLYLDIISSDNNDNSSYTHQKNIRPKNIGVDDSGYGLVVGFG